MGHFCFFNIQLHQYQAAPLEVSLRQCRQEHQGILTVLSMPKLFRTILSQSNYL
ncbi:hypothetical protein [Allocoleopsis franciscana]|uniref:hypothetical protein n=1 Tax=Allocoleopsis franciscana TaxID=2886352 RepID=UPI00030F5CBA|nr:hypothetical protein [Allocoleopsis franciscana]